MKAKDLIKILEQNPEAEVLHTILNYSTLSDLDPNNIIHVKKEYPIPESFVCSSSTEAVEDDGFTGTFLCNKDVIILDLKLK